LEDASVALFLQLTLDQLKHFIHARKFSGKQFLSSKLTPAGKALKKPAIERKLQSRLKLIVTNPILA